VGNLNGEDRVLLRCGSPDTLHAVLCDMLRLSAGHDYSVWRLACNRGRVAMIHGVSFLLKLGVLHKWQDQVEGQEVTIDGQKYIIGEYSPALEHKLSWLLPLRAAISVYMGHPSGA